MPIYEYQGQQYDIATDDQSAAKQKILDHLNSQGQAQQPQADPLGRFVAKSEEAAPQEGPKQVGENAPDFMRGLTNELGSLQQVYGGAKVLAGKALGSENLMQSGLESMKQGEARTEVKPTDDLTEAWKKGIGSVVGDWLPYQMGSGAGNILETLGFMGIGAGTGALTSMGAAALPGAVAGVVEKSLVKKGVLMAAESVLKETAQKELAAGATKEAAQATAKAASEKFVADETAKTLTDIQAKQYASAAAKNIGGNMGLISQAGLHGAGEVTQQAVQQAQEEGRAPTDIDMGRVVPAALVHGVADFVTEKIGLHALDGMAANSSGKMIQDIAKAIALTGTKEAVPETIQEIAQRYGAHMSLTDADALKDYLNTIGASYAMSVAPAGIGGVRANLAHRVGETAEEKALATKQGNAPVTLGPDGKPLVEPEIKDEVAPDQTTAKESIYDVPKQEASDYLAKIDSGETQPNASTLKKHLAAVGATMPDTGPGFRDRALEALKNHLAQETQNVGTTTVTGTDRTGTEIPGQQGSTGVTSRTTTTDTGGLGGAKPFVNLSEEGKGPKRATLEEKVEEQKQQAATQKNTGTPEQQDYLTTKNYYGAEAPGNVDTALVHAGHEIAFDNYDTTAKQEGVDPQIKVIADKKNAEQQAKRDQMAKELAGKVDEETGKKYTKNRIQSLVSNIPLYDAGSPLTFMSPQELADIYEEHTGKKQIESGERTKRQEHADRRNKFIETLDPLQKAKVNLVARKALEQEIVARESRKGQVAEDNKFKDRADKITKTADELSQELRTIEKAKIEEQEKKAQEAVEKEAKEEAEEKETLEAPLKKEKPVKKEKTTPKETGKSKLVKGIEEAIKTGFLGNVLPIVGNRTLNDRNTGVIARDLISILKNFSKTNKQVAQTKIVFGKVENDNPGKFDPVSNTITVQGNDKDGYTGTRPLTETIMHESAHAVLDHVFDNPDAYINSLPGEQRGEARAALNRLNNNYKVAKNKLGNRFNIGTIKEFAAEVFGNSKFQEALANLPSESSFAPKDTLFNMIARNIARVFGFGSNKDDAVSFKEIVEDLAQLVSVPNAKLGLVGKEVSYAKEAEKPNYGSILPGINKGSITEEQQPKNLKYFKDLLFTRQGWRRIANAVQNDRYEVKHWQNINDLAGLIYYSGNKMNNIYGQLVRAPAQAMNLYRAAIEGTREKLDKAVYDLSQATGYDVKNTLELLHNIAVGMHDFERREVKYLKIVPLDNTKKDFTHNGQKMTAAEFRDMAFKKLDDNKTSVAQARQLRHELNAIVFTKNSKGELSPNTKYVNELGESPRQSTTTDANGNTTVTGVSTDIANNTYNVSVLSHDEAKQRMAEYHAYPHKALVDEALQQLRELHTKTIELNKMANYWSQPVSNYVAFYGWDNYVPLTGLHTEEDEALNFNSKRMGRELQDKAYAHEGRTTESNNVVLQSMKDAVSAAGRAGRKDLTLAIKNAASKSPTVIDGKKVDLNPNGQGVLKHAKVILHLNFEDRKSDDVLNKLPQENTVFHYNPDGSIDIIEIAGKDRKMLESIRRTYTQTNPMVDVANKITSTLGMMHTRYNFNFAPLNFVRDALTNAWAIGAEMGPIQSAKFIADISTKVVAQNSLGKAMKVASLYENNDMAEIEKLAYGPGGKNGDHKGGDPIIKDMHEYIQKGGLVSYLQGLSIKSNLQQLNKDLGRSRIMRSKDQLDKFLDIWNNMFELSSRSAAYAISKQNFKASGMDEEAASNKAVEYAKNLANFEQVGKYGKELGSVFMFFRPSATGAVRAIEAIAPAFQSVENVIRDLPPGTSKEALDTFRKNFAERQRNARYMATALMGLGALAYTMSHMMAGDDDLGRNKVENDDPSQWTRFARFFIPGTDNPIQMPWGFGLGSFAAAGAQLAMAGTGHQSFGNAMGNIATQISLDSFVPIPVSRMPIQDNPALWMLDSLTPSMLRPAMEFVVNKNGLGQNIYNDANRRMGDAYLGGDNIPEIYKNIAKGLFDATDGAIDWSPNSIYFLSNSYVDGPARVIETTVNGMYLASGQAEEKDALARLKGAPLVGSFIGSVPNVDSREFSSIENQIKEKEKVYTQAQLKPEVEASYLEKNPLDPEIIDFYNHQVNGRLKELRQQANQIRLMQGLTPRDRAEAMKSIKQEENIVKYELVQQFKGYGLKP